MAVRLGASCPPGCGSVPSPGATQRSGADCPNAILVSASVKAGVVDGHHASGLCTSARVKRHENSGKSDAFFILFVADKETLFEYREKTSPTLKRGY